MSRIAYLDCNAGISGNMFLGALLDSGLPAPHLLQELKKLPIKLPEITITRTVKGGISAVYVDVSDRHEHHHRHLADIVGLINDSSLDSKVKDDAVRCFNILADAEAKVHGVAKDEIHFHEVGAVDAIVDIVGACIGLAYFNIKTLLASPVRMGFGTIQCAHGLIPLPGPAVSELLKGYKIYGGEYEGEWTTPTGAALLKTFTTGQGPIPRMNLESTGYGAGSADREIPNVLRLFLGESEDANDQDSQVILETNIDDMNPELLGNLGELLLNVGARDYYFIPIQMKKNRPGILVSVISPAEAVSSIEKVLFEETSTLGIRRYPVNRTCLKRGEINVEYDGQMVRVKTGLMEGKIIKYAPEYEDCLRISKILKRPLREIYNKVNTEAEKILSMQEDC